MEGEGKSSGVCFAGIGNGSFCLVALGVRVIVMWGALVLGRGLGGA